MIFIHFQRNDPQYRWYPGGKKNTTTDNVANLLIFLCILDGYLKDTAVDGPSEDES